MGKFDDILIVTDLDGTFLNSSERIPESNEAAVEYFKAGGGSFTVATGRVAQHVYSAIPQIAELINFPAVTCNGACLYDFRTGKTVVDHPMTHRDVMDIVEYIRAEYPQAGIRASSPDYCYVTTAQDLEKPLIAGDFERNKNVGHLVAPETEWEKAVIYKIVIRIDSDILPCAMEGLKARFGDRFSVTQSWPTIIDIQLGGINKGRTLKDYVRSTQGKNVKIYACGDYVNDLELLQAADISVCPSNAHPKIKEISRLCLCDNDEGLIAALIKRIEGENYEDQDNDI